MQDYKRLLRYARPYLGKLVAALLCAAGASLMFLALASLVPPLINDLIPSAQVAAHAASTHDTVKKFTFLDYSNKILGEDWITKVTSLGRNLEARGKKSTFLTVAVLALFLYLVKGVLVPHPAGGAGGGPGEGAVDARA